MKVTPFSKAPYYPFILSNGADAALVDYSGSMFTGDPKHAHRENSQGTPCGWYKMSHRMADYSIVALAQSGYDITFNGLKTEPMSYEQEFDARKAILTTIFKSRGIECRITSFMASKSLMVERYEIIAVPADAEIGLILCVQPARSAFGQTALRYPPELKLSLAGDNGINIEYHMGDRGLEGSGFMSLDRKTPNAAVNKSIGELRFENLPVGWSVTKFLSLSDNKDSLSYRGIIEANLERSRKGFDFVRNAHEREWLEYSGTSDISIPDENIQAIYDASVYSCRAHLHPETGGLYCGLLPNHWGGGVCFPDDANYSHVGFLRTGNPECANHHLEYFRRFREEGRRLAEKHNLPGVPCPVWANCFGEHLSPDYSWFVLYAKMSQLGCAVESFYWLWKYYPEHVANRGNLRIMEELLDLIYAGCLYDDGKEAYIRECKAGDETDRRVKNDTYTTLVFAHAFSGFEEMSKALGVSLKKEFAGIGKRLLAAAAKNIKDGYLYCYRDSEFKYFAPLTYIYHLPEGFPSADCVRNWANFEFCRTPWGLNGDNASECYRDWPWAGTRLAIALAHIGDSKDAFFWLKDSCKYAAATGALPEKIRIDGYPINYWYGSAHALFVWAMTFALCHNGKDGSLRLLYGLDGEWRDFTFDSLRVFDGLEVSAKVNGGAITALSIVNHAPWRQDVLLNVNPAYIWTGAATVSLESGATFAWPA